jgi:GNAT superfamily N-acetyltransferase
VTAAECKLFDFKTEASKSMIGAGEVLSVDTLKNGLVVTIRAIRSDDGDRLKQAFDKLDRASVYTRFFGYKKELSAAELERAINVDFETVVALVATIERDGAEVMIGGGRYATGPSGGTPHDAEIAFLVAENFQGLGVASLLLKHLAQIARAKGLHELKAEVLPENASMLAVFRRSGLPLTSKRSEGVVHITLGLGSQGS